MRKIRYLFIVLGVLLSSVSAAAVQVGIGIGLPHVSIGINFPVYPDLVVIPGYPVYYAPRQQANLFFYDGLYWIYQDDYWYVSSWYNGPWWIIEPEVVPVFILRVPVRYYRHPPAYFAGWRYDAPPRWDAHWGHNWNQRRNGWDRWDRRSAPQRAPAPTYQRQYSGDRYPQQVEQQFELHQQNYRYQPRDPVVKQHYKEQAEPKTSSQQEQRVREDHGNKAQDNQRRVPTDRDNATTPRSAEQQKRGADVQRSSPDLPQQSRPEVRNQGQQQPETEQRGQEGSPTTVRQNNNYGKDKPDSIRTQPPQNGGVNMQRPDRSTSQQGRLEAQDRQQQPRQESERQSQQSQGKNITNEPGRRQEQERGSSRHD